MLNTPTIQNENILLKQEQRRKIEIQNKKAEGKLLDAKEVEHEWANVLRDVRAGVLAIPSRLQSRLIHLSKNDIEIIEQEVRDVLINLAEQSAQRDNGDLI